VELLRVCPECNAHWFEGQLYYGTGKIGCPHDLAGLVCNDLDGKDCINPCKGSTSGLSWKNWIQSDKPPHLDDGYNRTNT